MFCTLPLSATLAHAFCLVSCDTTACVPPVLPPLPSAPPTGSPTSSTFPPASRFSAPVLLLLVLALEYVGLGPPCPRWPLRCVLFPPRPVFPHLLPLPSPSRPLIPAGAASGVDPCSPPGALTPSLFLSPLHLSAHPAHCHPVCPSVCSRPSVPLLLPRLPPATGKCSPAQTSTLPICFSARCHSFSPAPLVLHAGALCAGVPDGACAIACLEYVVLPPL